MRQEVGRQSKSQWTKEQDDNLGPGTVPTAGQHQAWNLVFHQIPQLSKWSHLSYVHICAVKSWYDSIERKTNLLLATLFASL